MKVFHTNLEPPLNDEAIKMQKKQYKLEAMKFVAGKSKQELIEMKTLAADVFQFED